MREILGSLEIVYHELFPHLNLRQWSSFIYQWLTQPHFDPTHSGRVTMDRIMKLVTTALERAYEAHETDVRAQMLSEHFTVFNVNRRARGESSDTAPYAIEREQVRLVDLRNLL